MHNYSTGGRTDSYQLFLNEPRHRYEQGASTEQLAPSTYEETPRSGRGKGCVTSGRIVSMKRRDQGDMVPRDEWQRLRSVHSEVSVQQAWSQRPNGAIEMTSPSGTRECKGRERGPRPLLKRPYQTHLANPRMLVHFLEAKEVRFPGGDVPTLLCNKRLAIRK
jgi:hypothetical protein